VVVTPRRSLLKTLGPEREAEQELHLLRFALRRLATPLPAGGPASPHAGNAAHAALRLQAMLLDPLLARWATASS
jgi:hypothetical protein